MGTCPRSGETKGIFKWSQVSSLLHISGIKYIFSKINK